MPTEADSCRRFIVPALQKAGWEAEPHSIAEQCSITDGRVVPRGRGFVRKAPQRVDYLVHYTRDFPLALLEAKAAYKQAADGMQQAKQYAEMLGLGFTYPSNDIDVLEFGAAAQTAGFPITQQLWVRSRERRRFGPVGSDRLLRCRQVLAACPGSVLSSEPPVFDIDRDRFYQRCRVRTSAMQECGRYQ